MKRFLTIALLLIAALAALLIYFHISTRPPDEGRVIANFNAHRTAYERLREMLTADQNLLRVAPWGVETNQPVKIQTPPDGLSKERYQEYLLLFKETAALGATRGRGTPPESIGILVWASGFGGDTRHVDICWVEKEPAPVVSSMKEFYHSPLPRQPSFIKIEDHWYIWADW